MDALASASDQTRPKFLDLQFLRNRRLQSATHLVRPWFVKVDAWLLGTRAVEQEAGAFFDQEEQVSRRVLQLPALPCRASPVPSLPWLTSRLEVACAASSPRKSRRHARPLARQKRRKCNAAETTQEGREQRRRTSAG